jgi:DNA-binding transcriptional ArsR family regulator
VSTNILAIEGIAELLQIISQPARLQILLTIGDGEACVCHLEAVLGWRQAYISQHLMALREAGLVTDRRQGRFIHYRLRDPRLLDLVRQAARLRGEQAEIDLSSIPSADRCQCPKCAC